MDKDEVMCQGHKCYKMINWSEARSPFTLNIALCPDCYERLMLEMIDEYLEKKREL